MITGLWEADSFVANALLSVWPDAPAGIVNTWFLQYVFLLISTVPCFLTTKMSFFVPVAWIGLVATIVAVGCLAIQAFHAQFESDFRPQIPLANWDFSLVYGSLSGFNIAFFAHPMVVEAARDMASPTRRRILSATWFANILCGICVYLIPAFGFLALADVEDGENVFHYLNPSAPEVIVGKFAVIVNMACSDMLFQFFLAKSVAGSIWPAAEHSREALALAGLVAGAVAIAVNFLDEFSSTLFFGVAVNSFSLLAFILPPVFFFAQYGSQNLTWAILAALVLLIGGGMMILSLIGLVQDLVAL
jgi:hypothetical protein